MPPYEGRNESTSTGSGARAHTAGATHPVSDPNSKAPHPARLPEEPPRSAAQEQPASEVSETESDDEGVGPTHTPGPGRAEDKLYSFAFVVSTQLVGAYGDDLVLPTTQRD